MGKLDEGWARSLSHACQLCQGQTCTLCGDKCLKLEPPVIICQHCNKRVVRGGVYHITRDGCRLWCSRCHPSLPPELPIDGDPDALAPPEGEAESSAGATGPPAPSGTGTGGSGSGSEVVAAGGGAGSGGSVGIGTGASVGEEKPSTVGADSTEPTNATTSLPTVSVPTPTAAGACTGDNVADGDGGDAGVGVGIVVGADVGALEKTSEGGVAALAKAEAAVAGAPASLGVETLDAPATTTTEGGGHGADALTVSAGTARASDLAAVPAGDGNGLGDEGTADRCGAASSSGEGRDCEDRGGVVNGAGGSGVESEVGAATGGAGVAPETEELPRAPLKRDLLRRKFDEEISEPWVQCDRCNSWVHQVGLCLCFMERVVRYQVCL